MKERRRKKGRKWGFSSQSTITLDTRTIIAGGGGEGWGGGAAKEFGTDGAMG